MVVRAKPAGPTDRASLSELETAHAPATPDDCRPILRTGAA